MARIKTPPYPSSSSSAGARGRRRTTTLYWLMTVLMGSIIIIATLPTAASSGDDDCTFSPRNASFEFTHELVSYSVTAAQLSAMTYRSDAYRNIKNGNAYGYESLQVWRDYNDLAMLAKDEDGVCYAAFRGTQLNPADVFQLYNANERWVGGCKVRAGFHHAYFSRYYSEFRAAVGQCMESPASELVVTGQSQGGSIAIVAFLDLQEYRPIAISFGALRTLVQPCGAIDPSRHYRYTNCGDGMYDEWAQRFSHSAMHMGHSIMLDATASAPAAYLGLGDNKSRAPQSMVVHDPLKYLDGIKSMAQSACDPIRISGWEDGHWCNENEECDSGSCVNQICIGTLPEGDPCEKDMDCKSRTCKTNWWGKSFCA